MFDILSNRAGCQCMPIAWHHDRSIADVAGSTNIAVKNSYMGEERLMHDCRRPAFAQWATTVLQISSIHSAVIAIWLWKARVSGFESSVKPNIGSQVLICACISPTSMCSMVSGTLISTINQSSLTWSVYNDWPDLCKFSGPGGLFRTHITIMWHMPRYPGQR